MLDCSNFHTTPAALTAVCSGGEYRGRDIVERERERERRCGEGETKRDGVKSKTRSKDGE